MGCFDFLPRFNKCCMCIPLQAGCFIIGVWALISGIIYAGFSHKLEDHVNCEYFSFLNYIYLPMGIIMVVTAVFFLLGMCRIFRGSWTAHLFMWAIFLPSLGVLILSIVLCILTHTMKCEGDTTYRCGTLPFIFITFLLTLHHIGCVNVYKDEM